MSVFIFVLGMMAGTLVGVLVMSLLVMSSHGPEQET
jgi:hypothetical protein